MRLVVLPGTFPPHSDSWQLGGELSDVVRARDRPRVVDVGTGSGLLATIAALHGGLATAIDASRRALLSALLTARVNGVRIRARRGDLLAPVDGERFDVIVSNPPYVPSASDRVPGRGPSLATDAGRDGRAVLDRLCATAPSHLVPGGELLLIHSEVCDVERTLEQLRDRGLRAEVAARFRGGFGTLLTERREMLIARGLLAADQLHEDVVIIRGRREPTSAALPTSR
jgi:release factor glutamine methyltransferase